MASAVRAAMQGVTRHYDDVALDDAAAQDLAVGRDPNVSGLFGLEVAPLISTSVVLSHQ